MISDEAAALIESLEATIAVQREELDAARAELALLRPAGRAVVKCTKRIDDDQVRDMLFYVRGVGLRLVKAGWTGGEE